MQPTDEFPFTAEEAVVIGQQQFQTSRDRGFVHLVAGNLLCDTTIHRRPSLRFVQGRLIDHCWASASAVTCPSCHALIWSKVTEVVGSQWQPALLWVLYRDDEALDEVDRILIRCLLSMQRTLLTDCVMRNTTELQDEMITAIAASGNVIEPLIRGSIVHNCFDGYTPVSEYLQDLFDRTFNPAQRDTSPPLQLIHPGLEEGTDHGQA